MRWLLLLGSAAAALAASAAAVPAGPAESSLRVVFRADEGAKPVVRTLRCGPAGGTLPRAAQACRRLAAMRRPFAPTPKGMTCTEIYGGPQTALVAGTYAGRRIWTRFARRNGCEIDRWTRHAFLFPDNGS
jgi:hypothetical protein